MKIIHFIVGLGDGGAEKSLAKLVVNERRHQHIVLSLTGSGKYGPVIAESGPKVYSLEFGFATTVSNFTKILRIVRSEGPDAIHGWMPHGALVGSIVARIVGIRKVFWSIRATDYGKWSRSLMTHIIVRILSIMSHTIPRAILVVGEQALRSHLRLGFARRKMVVVTNGYRDSRAADSQISDSLPAQILDAQRRGLNVFGSVARFHPQKDHDSLLKALSIVALSRSDWVCVLVGEGIDDSNYKLTKAITDLGLTGRVFLLGAVDEPSALYRNLDLHFLSSSYGEGFPNVVAESMMEMVPNVVTDVGDAALIVGDAGWVVPKSEPAAFATAVLNFLELTAVERETLGHKARERVVSAYSLEKMVDGFVGQYEKIKVAVFPRYSSLGASSRVRFYQYAPKLEASNFEAVFSPFLPDKYLADLYRGSRQSSATISWAYLNRIAKLWNLRYADVWWVEKELIPWVPSAIERLLLPQIIPRLVVDFDDAIWEQFREFRISILRGVIERKIPKSLSRAQGVVVGNQSLLQYAKEHFDGDTHTIPSVIDSSTLHPGLEMPETKFIFGWIGTPVTFKRYVLPLMDLYESIAQSLGAEFWLIGAGEASMSNEHIKNWEWSSERESKLLNSIDVGLMPLKDDAWSRGKCGYKIIQSMAVGSPVLASPVGVNREIIQHGENGFLIHSEEEWGHYLSLLATQPELRKEMGESASATVRQKFTVDVTLPDIVKALSG